jgi:hypothetical protein
MLAVLKWLAFLAVVVYGLIVASAIWTLGFDVLAWIVVSSIVAALFAAISVAAGAMHFKATNGKSIFE